MTTTIRPTRQALRLHQSHLATTHRAPLVTRGEVTTAHDAHDAHETHDGGVRTRTRATAFTPLRRDPLSVERHLTFQPAASHGHPDEA
ncbi:hypothetical protein [Intrasporangium flavum]|uniref:hypothetical protein n=1 Tax=Intrasporangium flavum TaxID=1428657 RepID=UPI00096EA9C8|nr:hypothetical protein [Intrasporangium flavum]